MKRFIILLGFLLLCFLLIRRCTSEPDFGPRELEAYGYAQYNPKEQTLTIVDELDTVKNAKTYVTTYAKMGFDNQTVDFKHKVYVYVSENTVSLISNVEQGKANQLQFFAMLLAERNFFYSYLPWVILGIGGLMVFAYQRGFKAMIEQKSYGNAVVNLIWWVGFIAIFLNIFNFFDNVADKKQQNPMLVSNSISVNELVLDRDVLSETALSQMKKKFIYQWEGDVFVSSEKLQEDECSLLLSAYFSWGKRTLNFYIAVIIVIFFVATHYMASYYANKLLKERERLEQEEQEEED